MCNNDSHWFCSTGHQRRNGDGPKARPEHRADPNKRSVRRLSAETWEVSACESIVCSFEGGPEGGTGCGREWEGVGGVGNCGGGSVRV